MDKYAVATVAAKTGESTVGGRWAGALHVTGAVTVTDKFGQEHICPYWANMRRAGAHIGRVLAVPIWAKYLQIWAGAYLSILAHIGRVLALRIRADMGLLRMAHICAYWK